MLTLLLAAQLAAAGPPGKIPALGEWIDAVESHRAGQLDAAARRAVEFSPGELDRIRIDLRTVLKLIREPDATVFYPTPDIDISPRSTPIVYTREELVRLRQMAVNAARRGDGNRLVKRAAVLHTDLGMLAPAVEGGSSRGGGRLRRTTVYVEDGRQIAVVDTVDHWEMSRRLLDEVRSPQGRGSGAAKDADVRLWYAATTAHFVGLYQVSLPHYDDATRLFPDDPDVAFFCGAMREMASAPGVYSSLKNAKGLPSSMNLESQEGELRLAEALFRRAVAASPTHAEARVRLGRVLARLGRPADAAAQLRRAAAATSDPLVLYYAYLFLGGAADAQGDIKSARAAYERARTLYPNAQSPHVALSQLLAREGNRRDALAALDDTLSERALDDRDPYWGYHEAAGRDHQALLGRMYAALSPDITR